MSNTLAASKQPNAAQIAMPGFVRLNETKIDELEQEVERLLGETDDYLFKQMFHYALGRSTNRMLLKAGRITLDHHNQVHAHNEKLRTGSIDDFLKSVPQAAADNPQVAAARYLAIKTAAARLNALDSTYGNAGLYRFTELALEKLISSLTRHELLGLSAKGESNIIALSKEAMEAVEVWKEKSETVRAYRLEAYEESLGVGNPQSIEGSVPGLIGLTPLQIEELEKVVGIAIGIPSPVMLGTMWRTVIEVLALRDKLITRHITLQMYDEGLVEVDRTGTMTIAEFRREHSDAAASVDDATVADSIKVAHMGIGLAKSIDVKFGNAGLARLMERMSEKYIADGIVTGLPNSDMKKLGIHTCDDALRSVRAVREVAYAKALELGLSGDTGVDAPELHEEPRPDAPPA